MSARTINRLLIAIACLAVFYGLLLFWQYKRTAPGVSVPVGTAGLSRAADKLVVKTGGRTATLARRGEHWFAGKKRVGKVKIANLLKAVDELTFIRVVSAKPDDLKAYGFDKAQGNSLRIFQGKKALKTLYFGSSLGNSFYVRVAGDPAVYEAEGQLFFEVSQPAGAWAAPERKIK